MRPLLAAAAVLLFTGTASAYPTAAVFTPTGEAMPGGTVCVFTYASTNLAPAVSPGATWLGAQVGVLPQFDFGAGLRFGGLEVGFDTISPYGDGVVKPVLNAKLAFVTEGSVSPALAAGIVEVSPALPSMNLLYVSATKTLRSGDGPSFGRLTLGFGGSAGDRAQFNGTVPFQDTRLSLLAAYESPLVATRVGAVVDYLGGASEVSSTYGGVTPLVFNMVKVAAGVYIANDRSNASTTYDGLFAYLMTAFDALTLFQSPPQGPGMMGPDHATRPGLEADPR